MPHITRPMTVAPADSIVVPISGNTEHGGACYDGSGKALYGVYDGTDFTCFRTIGNAKTFVDIDDSVEELSTIVAGPFHRQRNCALTNIDGTIYANITGGDGTNFGQWIYRDTGGGGTGPWVLHGTVSELPVTAETDFAPQSQGGNLNFFCNGGEIVTFDADNWAVAHVRATSDPGGAQLRYGMAASDDGGETWVVQWDYYQWTLGAGTYDFHTHTPTFGKDSDGFWWGNWNGNEAEPIRSWSSNNTWSNGVTVGENGNASRGYQFSVMDRVYAITNDALLTPQQEPLEYTDGTPTAGPWTEIAHLADAGLTESNLAHCGVYNIGSEGSPILACIKRGEVLSLGAVRSGWVIGRVGPTW